MSPEQTTFHTGAVSITCAREARPVEGATDAVLGALDARRGALLTSTFQYPGRYTRWDLGFVDPPIVLEGRGRELTVSALNDRGVVLLDVFADALAGCEELVSLDRRTDRLVTRVAPADSVVPEEQRSRHSSVFSLLRRFVAAFRDPSDRYLGLYGAFGYDLALQFEPLRLRQPRDPRQRDLVLYLPDELVVVDHEQRRAEVRRYDFAARDRTTAGLPRVTVPSPYAGPRRPEREGDHEASEYEAVVREARQAFARGDLFEVVPSRTFFRSCPTGPSAVFARLRAANPAPYGFVLNLGDGEHLVGASPEMFVRVDGDRVETCPIAGTIARGRDPLEDATQIARLIASAKDEAELTMCTDVDRNDKSRICRPGTVKVLGRRQIEVYSRLIHTVDHVEGRLRPDLDALDALLSHMWAVTVTGAPKTWAMQFIEDHERSPRAFYGGAVGVIGFDGGLNTGITIRTIRIRDGVAEVRAGATLLHDSDEREEERETRLKASALLGVLEVGPGGAAPSGRRVASRAGERPRRVLVVDHEDSFVHTLADYFRQAGAHVTTLRAPTHRAVLGQPGVDLVVLSPGPGRPADFAVAETIDECAVRGLPVFGVCLGLQGLVEREGGALGVLPTPAHGKPASIQVHGGALFDGLPGPLVAGRYHSLHALKTGFPASLKVTAETDDGVVMAVEHRELPFWAVQFHPESILSLQGETGLRLVGNVVRTLCGKDPGGQRV